MFRRIKEGFCQVFRVDQKCIVLFLPMATKSPFLCVGDSNYLSSLLTDNCSYRLFNSVNDLATAAHQLEYDPPKCALRFLAPSQVFKEVRETIEFYSPRINQLLSTSDTNLETEDASDDVRYKFLFFNDHTVSIHENTQKIWRFSEKLWNREFSEEMLNQQLLDCLAYIRVFGTDQPLVVQQDSRPDKIIQHVTAKLVEFETNEPKLNTEYSFWLEGKKKQQLNFGKTEFFNFQNTFSPVFYLETQQVLDNQPELKLVLKSDGRSLGHLNLKLYSSKLLSNGKIGYCFHHGVAGEDLVSYFDNFHQHFLLKHCLNSLKEELS